MKRGTKQILIANFILASIGGMGMAYMPEFPARAIGAFAVGWMIKDMINTISKEAKRGDKK